MGIVCGSTQVLSNKTHVNFNILLQHGFCSAEPGFNHIYSHPGQGGFYTISTLDAKSGLDVNNFSRCYLIGLPLRDSQ